MDTPLRLEPPRYRAHVAGMGAAGRGRTLHLGGNRPGAHLGWHLFHGFRGSVVTSMRVDSVGPRVAVSLYRGRLFSNAVAKIMGIFSNRLEAAFSDVLRILIRQ